MVAAINDAGLRVVMDVVYNHTTAAGQDEKSVLDRIVPGYYHRLSPTGTLETSTCCSNTATEHAMMEKLTIDSVVTWARDYKVDGFRFDLMGHHSRSTMEKVRAALDALTVEDDGVNGSSVYVYGEGWNFGEVANNARFQQASQLELFGAGIGTFSDRLRDAVRGGGPFDDDPRIQGFASGLFSEPNSSPANGSEGAQRDRLLLYHDQIKVGLAGNLRDYTFVDRTGATVRPADGRPGADEHGGARHDRAGTGAVVLARWRGPAAVEVTGPELVQLRRLVQPGRLELPGQHVRVRPASGVGQRAEVDVHGAATGRPGVEAWPGRHLGRS
jgi:pullulanase/glycogen debranching enzyme